MKLVIDPWQHCAHSQPTHLSPFIRKRVARALHTIFARSEFSAHFSSIWIRAYVMVIPGNLVIEEGCSDRTNLPTLQAKVRP